MDILLLIVGLGLILAGANFLTDGSAAVAQRFRVPEFIIGLTIVAVGTSTPELLFFPISYKAAGKRTAEEFWITARVKWLFGLLRMNCDYPDPGKICVKFLFFTLYDSSIEKPEKTDRTSTETTGNEKTPASAEQKRVFSRYLSVSVRCSVCFSGFSMEESYSVKNKNFTQIFPGSG